MSSPPDNMLVGLLLCVAMLSSGHFMENLNSAAKNLEGIVQQAVGSVVQSEDLKSRGKQKRIEVAHKRMFNSEPTAAQANLEKAKGALKETFGKGVHSERLQRTGMAQREHGRARHDAVKNADVLTTNLNTQLDSEFQVS
ncbi:hypothetical protein K493DRAFT_354014 [Basidiobolus meristosporus CBS 931.73]|uniref:Uncharacterized protein n=1 Tax=Basidiobolus meristosporus CBS 931.73 TaxID=1314790 RepID=A0A1Y1Y5E3_9FUNG|nr:hypothetical protein K493DRAFT_354014 [Basidiobolus meristosporus CBS 931.73]|eukprot:ORX92834.1 hypothetical protein K493DRAFT_354014 [Basidiobolus meristosporus CBS 931.73]